MLDRPPGRYSVFADRDVVDHLAGLPNVRDILGGEKSDWQIGRASCRERVFRAV